MLVLTSADQLIHERGTIFFRKKILAINNHHAFDIYQFNVIRESRKHGIARSFYRYSVVMICHSLYANAISILIAFVYLCVFRTNFL